MDGRLGSCKNREKSKEVCGLEPGIPQHQSSREQPTEYGTIETIKRKCFRREELHMGVEH